MNKNIISNICKYINNQGRFVTSNEIIENALWFNLASIVSAVSPKVLVGSKEMDINYFGITIASSSAGKSFSHNQIKKIFKDEIKGWEKALKINYNNLSKETEEINIDGFATELKNFLPSYEISVEGTSEGLYARALALSKCCIGSLNIVHEEIMDIITQSNLNSLKELYDGRMLGKVIKSNVNENIYGIRANMLLFGSSIGLKRDIKVYEYFNKALGSGIYRRSFIYYEEPKDIKTNEDKKDNVDISFLNVKEFLRNYYQQATKYCEPVIITLSKEAEEYTELINHELLEFANKYKEDERFSAEVGSFDKIIKLSALRAILENRIIVRYEDIEYAYSFYKRLRNTNERLFNVEPQHKRIYRILKRYGTLTKSELLEKDIFNRTTLNEDIKLLEELAYRNNEQLKITGSKIKKYSIEPLPSNDLKKIIVSIPKIDKKEKTTEYISLELPFFGERSIEKLVVSNKVSNFCLVHFEKGKRKAENAIEGQNAIGIDVDDGMKLEEALEKLRDYTYIVYTTKSHQKEKDGFVADRFRVILPTKNKFYVDNERHKQLIENVCEVLGFGSYDISTRNIDRLWFTNPEGQVFKNQGELFDVIPFLPETEVNELVGSQVAKFNEADYDENEVMRRIGGMIKWVLSTTYKGNRNINLFRLGSFVLDLTGDVEKAKEEVYKVNNMLQEPISEKELKHTIFKSLERKS